MKKLTILFILLFELCCSNLFAQPFPSADEKIPFLCTFSKDSQKDWGDDDFVQIYFFVVPQTEKNPIYIRVFDPDLGGKYDEVHDVFNSKTRFSVYGGNGAASNPDAKKQTPTGNFKSGIQLSSKTFGDDANYDDKWYTLGPFNPVEGELQPDGYVFKLIIEGMDGDDGNLYKMFLSSLPNENKAIEGGNAFTYEYSFRMADNKGSISHLYPFVSKGITAVKISVFDFDDDGILRVVSVAKKGEITKSSGNAVWLENTHKITTEELNTSLDIQFVKQQDSKNNNVVVYITNQYGELMPFYATPIGGVPKYKFKIGVKVDN
ncbi:MAG TPA: hypothetical protein VK835_03685 [Bacteroidia bacterium]|jgi:hypothetical protein|nr:hypothetical protein [Bacteroidia bacterium]